MKPPDEVVEAIVRALELDDAAIARYKAFLEFTDEDVARLKALHAALRGLAPEFAQAFYDHLLGFEETRRFIPDTPTLERLKQTQAAYFDRLTAGDYGRDYIQHRLRVGVAHQRVGLSPHWYLGAYGKYLSGLLPEIWQRLGKDPRRSSPPCRRSSRSCSWTWGLPSTPISMPTGRPSWRSKRMPRWCLRACPSVWWCSTPTSPSCRPTGPF
ncbi:protoglobin domain-containing protein [Pelomicrobium methylotrophicum]|nr:protoglobin domain-containing protein [Pelomicrobium methylotrophicum]